ncbi:MAG: hypothetical protein GX438_07930 [Treponema sp.]|nr:hypothetical protein [Treponema sp.]
MEVVGVRCLPQVIKTDQPTPKAPKESHALVTKYTSTPAKICWNNILLDEFLPGFGFVSLLVTATMTPYKTKTGPGITTCTEQRN